MVVGWYIICKSVWVNVRILDSGIFYGRDDDGVDRGRNNEDVKNG